MTLGHWSWKLDTGFGCSSYLFTSWMIASADWNVGPFVLQENPQLSPELSFQLEIKTSFYKWHVRCHLHDKQPFQRYEAVTNCGSEQQLPALTCGPGVSGVLSCSSLEEFWVSHFFFKSTMWFQCVTYCGYCISARTDCGLCFFHIPRLMKIRRWKIFHLLPRLELWRQSLDLLEVER